jgi:AcrR family transcriptional regulator
MTKQGHKKVEHGKQTAAELIRLARDMFSKRGYAHTSMEELVRTAGLTRGALYHHFPGKKGLFLAAFESAQTDIAARISQALDDNLSAWEQLISATFAFFEACRDPELQQIALIDAPAILGWNVWRRVDEEKTHHILQSLLKKLIDDRVIKPIPLQPLTHLVAGAANEAVLWIAQSEDPARAFEEAWSAMETLLHSLRR